MKGDIVFNNTNSPELVGKTAYYDVTDVAVISNHMTRIRVDAEMVDAEFLARFLHHLWQTGQSRDLAKQWVSQAAIDQDALSGFQILLPPLPEQHRIASILSHAAGLRRQRRAADELVQKFLPALFHEMFGNPLKNERSWVLKPLGKMGEVVTGNTPPRKDSTNYGDYIEWVKTDNLDGASGSVTPALEKLSEKGSRIARIVPPGSTLVACIAGSLESIGRAAITDREVAFNQQINAIIPADSVNPFFLYFAIRLAKPLIQDKAGGMLKYIVNKSRFESVRIIAPPKDLQDDFAEKALAVNHVLPQSVELESGYDHLFQALLGRAFTGELTEAWRGQHEAELREAAQQRDEWLERRGRGAKTVQAVVTEPASIQETLSPRHVLLQELSQAQRAIHLIANTQMGYFTAQSLAAAQGLDPEQTRRGLPLLEAIGLIHRVSLVRSESSETNPNNPVETLLGLEFAPIYRALRPEDDSRADDMSALQAAYPELAAPPTSDEAPL